MKIGVIGLGKLGLPCAVAIAAKNHNVIGYDINPAINSNKHPKDILLTNEANEHGDGSINDMINSTTFKIVDTMEEIILHSELIFIAIQTPHKKIYEGCDIMPAEREDFDYSHLINCISSLNTKINNQNETKIVIIISTVLPGTLRSNILPIISNKIKLCYNPYFIAMGTVVYDFYHPEFILLGTIDEEAELKVVEFYKTITSADVYSTTLENAEMIKVSYNTFITTKIVFANNIMEMCHKLPNTNVDVVMNGLKKATNRLISTKYLTGGMGDGGGCHPRDNIAMSWLSNKLQIKNNYYDFIMRKREEQTSFFADIIMEQQRKYNLDIMILGTAFKPETNLDIGSPAILLKNILKYRNIECGMFDPYIDCDKIDLSKKKIYFIGCAHKIFLQYKFTSGSIIIDPHRYIQKSDDTNVIYVGIYGAYIL